MRLRNLVAVGIHKKFMMNYFARKKQYVVIAGCLLLSFVMGSIHAFSILLEPIETKFYVSRTFSSFTYSLSLISITAAVYFGSSIYKKFTPTTIVLIVMTLSTLGTLISALSASIYFVWIGYGILFGFANGLGYGYTLQYSAIALPESKALMMGLVTASYGLGATIAPIFYRNTNMIGGFVNTMTSLTIIFFIITFIVFSLFRFSNLEFDLEKGLPFQIKNCNPISKYLLWGIYGCSISAGLMCFGHAAGIAKSFYISNEYIYIIPITMGFLNMAGGVLFSSLIKFFHYKNIILFLSMLTTFSLLILLLIPSKISVFLGLPLISISYGGIIAIFPSMINKLVGNLEGIKIYGFVFTAWGFFGLLMPLLAGKTFDISNSYSFIILIATILSIFPILIIYLKYKKLLI